MGHFAINTGHVAMNMGHVAIKIGYVAINIGHFVINIGHVAINIAHVAINVGHVAIQHRQCLWFSSSTGHVNIFLQIFTHIVYFDVGIRYRSICHPYYKEFVGMAPIQTVHGSYLLHIVFGPSDLDL